MQNKELIDNYVDALVKGNSKFLWEHNDFRSVITAADERAYLKKRILKRLEEMHENAEEEFEKNEKRFNEMLKENGLEKVFS